MPVKRESAAAWAPSIYRNDFQYRTMVDGAGSPLNVGCGFMVKPTEQGHYRNRVLQAMVVVLVLRGTGTYTDRHDQAHRVETGCMIVLPPGQKHSVVQDSDGQWAEFYMTTPPQLYVTMREMGSITPQRCVYRPGTGPGLISRMEALHGLMHDSADHDLPLVWAHCHLLLVEMLQMDRLGQQATSPLRRQMLEACRLLADPSSRHLTPAATARKLGIGYENFRKVFRQEIGVSPGEFRIRRRLDTARKLIADHQLSNKEVAYRLGYADPFTFSKQFRRYTGQSPAAFRASM